MPNLKLTTTTPVGDGTSEQETLNLSEFTPTTVKALLEISYAKRGNHPFLEKLALELKKFADPTNNIKVTPHGLVGIIKPGPFEDPINYHVSPTPLSMNRWKLVLFFDNTKGSITYPKITLAQVSEALKNAYEGEKNLRNLIG